MILRKPFPFLVAVASVAVGVLFAACGDSSGTKKGGSGKDGDPVITKELQAKSSTPATYTLKCLECHATEWEMWAKSQHAHANRLVFPDLDTVAFDPPQTSPHGSFVNKSFISDGKFGISTTHQDGNSSMHFPEAVIGVEPLLQYLVPFPGGRLQVVDMAFDTDKHEFFNVYRDEDRQPHEWGYWKNRSMNWNVQCAFCHMTELDKGYDIATDSFDTTWTDMGISCIQCHGHLDAHVADSEAPVAGYPRTEEQIIHNCASCHTRREEFTGTFKAGDNFFDHFRPSLADTAHIYYADGQILDEDFEYGSFLMSRMGHMGVSCLDCHNPHSGKLVLPADDNSLCMSCHTDPGRDGATVIDIASHTHHEAGSEGNKCVECHMAETTYMARDPRRDHGFVIPDPVLTKELGIPNSCNRCHKGEGEDVDWAIKYTNEWYGEKMNRRSRERARVVARAQSADPDGFKPVVDMLAGEEIPAWRAVLLSVMRNYVGRNGARELFSKALEDEHPLVRSAGVAGLSLYPDSGDEVDKMLDDPRRLVRIDAQRDALFKRRTLTPEQRAEFQEYMENISTQPGGASLQAQVALAEDRREDASKWIAKTVEWDPSPGAYHMSGQFQYQLDDLAAAETHFLKAMKMEPQSREHPYALALLYAETNRPLDALKMLEKAVEIDPQFGRGWYNLGLAYAGQEQLSKAVSALEKAESAMPQSPDSAYARATVHLRQGDKKSAREAARKALRISPGYQPAQGILMQTQ